MPGGRPLPCVPGPGREERIGPDHPILPWLIEEAGAILSRCTVGKDGRTPQERLKGKKSVRPLAEFGECIWYKPLGKDNKNKMDEQWRPGVWLGVLRQTEEVLVGTGEGTVKARSVRRRPQKERWNSEEIRGITVSYTHLTLPTT